MNRDPRPLPAAAGAALLAPPEPVAKAGAGAKSKTPKAKSAKAEPDNDTPVTPVSEGELPLERMICFAIYSAGLAFNRLYKPLLDRFGLTYPQYLVLVLLRESGAMSVGAIGERLFLESNTLTPLIKRMEAAGIVSRRRDGADERVVRVSLTEAGRKIAAEATCIPPAILAATGAEVAALEDLRGALTQLRDTVRAEDMDQPGDAPAGSPSGSAVWQGRVL